MTIKESIISIDGIDKTGKDSVRKLMIQMSGGKVLVKVRTFMSQIVYSRIYDRRIDEDFFINKMLEYQKIGEKFFMLTCNNEVLRERFILSAEKDLKQEDIETHQKIFNDVSQYMQGKGIHIITLDTSYDSVLETATHIFNSIENG